MSPHASVNGQAPRRRPHPAQPGGPGAAYGRHVGPCEALRTPLPSTDALDTLFTLRVASQRRDSTAKALAEPLLERCKPLSELALFSAVASPAAKAEFPPKRRDVANFAYSDYILS